MQSRACAGVFCSILLCSGGTVLMSHFWDFFIKVATLLFKAVCLLTDGVKQELWLQKLC